MHPLWVIKMSNSIRADWGKGSGKPADRWMQIAQYSGAKSAVKINRKLWILFLLFVFLGACSGCMPAGSPNSVLAKELVLYNWTDYMPKTVLDEFEKEYGVKIKYLTYDAAEEAASRISNGQINFDVAVVDNDNLKNLITQNLLAKINLQQVPNFKNISANFRDWSADPGNLHSIPFNFGTTGLLVRSDLAATPVRHWSDLWDEQYAGKIAVRAQSTELISVALRSLGYPLNSEDPAQLQAALERLLSLKSRVRFVDTDTESAIKPLLDGEVVILLGWNGDAWLARDRNSAIDYVIPEDGTMLWGDSFVISAVSPNQSTAQVFINFLLRPEIGAEIVGAYHYATTNEAVRSLLPFDLANDPLIYPSNQFLLKNNFYCPLSPAGARLYQDIWAQMMGNH
jgi:spermidine/putrescine transport system substrate-binding protein